MSTYAEWAEKNESQIFGDGWGADHLWHYESTPSNTSYYKCARCFWPFGHAYNHTPDIFKAMKEGGVPDKCARQQLWPIRFEYASEAEKESYAQARAELATAQGARP